MDKKFESLFTPWKIGNVEIKNRIVLCPMGGTSLFGWMEPNHFDKDAAKFFLDKAKNNVGLIITGIAPIRNAMGGKWLYKSKGMFKKLSSYMDEIHKTGAKLFVQLTAGFGRSFAITNSLAKIARNRVLRALCKPIMDLSYISAAPSKLPNRWAEDIFSRPLTVEEIDEMILAFAKTSKMLKDAGVDGVEVHAVHEGYLLDQFTLKYTNNRTDSYGGNFENRYRFPVEIVKAIKKECGKDYPVSLRYSVVSKTKDFCSGAMPGEEFTEIGRDMEESEKAAKYLQDAGYDMLNCDNGTYDAWYWAHPPEYMPNNCNLEDVSHIRKFVTIPVVCAGKMDPITGAKAIKENKIDAMGVARQFLVDGHWVTKILENRLDEIQPCICCHNGCFTMAHYKGVANDQPFNDVTHMARCALNPQTMNNGKYDIKKARKSKNIAIIGGGVGGMECARIATLRGHNVTIYEKSDKLGGVYIPASAPDFKERDKRLLEWYKNQIKNLKIKVVFNTEVSDIKSLNADEVVIATGSKRRMLNIKGFNKAVDACDYLNDNSLVGNKVLIIGGGLTGCEVAYDLYLKGKTPIIVESKQDLIAVSGVSLANSSYLRDFFKLNKVEVYLNSFVKEIKKGSVVVADKNCNLKEIKVDSVISAVGYVPNPILKRKRHIHIIGDAYKVGNLRTVVWRAWKIAEKF